MQHLLLLHGALGAKDQLAPLALQVKDKYIVHTLDFSGHGGRPFSEKPFSIASFGEDVLNYLEENSIEKLSVFGYSMGGYVAMWLARYYPEKIEMVITLATKFYWDENVAAKEVKMLDAETIAQKVPAFARQLEARHLPNDWKEVLEKTKDLLFLLGKTDVLLLNGFNNNIRIPCLLLLGEKDKMVTKEETEDMQAQLLYAAMEILPDTPHPLEQVDMTILAATIKDFLG
jgi:pimeloyl-ACP methyl ester carboxylesterase